MRGIHRSCLLVLCAWMALSSQGMAAGQSLDTPAVDSLVREALNAWQVPGAAVAIIKGDELVYLKGFGVKQLGKNEPVTPDTLFAIGSTTKAFTTAAIAILVDEAKMSWDDAVSKHIEFFRLSDPLANENVTLRDIVSHRTGLNRNDLLWYASPWNREEIIRKIGMVKLNRSFRSTYQYQNIMFLTAGYAAGAAAKTTWENLVQTRILQPLGMTGTNFSTTVAENAPDHASPHRKNKENKVEVTQWRNIDNIAPAGSMNSGVRDLSKWVRFQLGDGTIEGKRLVSAAGLAEMHTPQTVMRLEGPTKAFNPETNMIAYGLGWVIQDYRGQLQVSHGGNIDGFTARIAMLPKAKLGLVILANLNGTQMNSALSNSIVDLNLGLTKKDWNAVLAEEVRKQEAEQKAREKEREEKRHKGTKPSRDLTSYTGAYEDPAYGEGKVYLEGGNLILQWSNFRSRLEHYHFDTFTAKEDRLENEQVLFTLGADGDIATMSLLGVDFKRVKPKPQGRSATQ